tara:strand:- start:1554 stop:2237 length:684 start_codon:yes stop_codon:yes gene_type:complete
MGLSDCFQASSGVERICNLGWEDLSENQVKRALHGFYFFSQKFVDNLRTASNLYPEDDGIKSLMQEELNTDNLSPYNGVADEGEAMDHDVFLRRVIQISGLSEEENEELFTKGKQYLEAMDQMPPEAQLQCLVSCEDGGAIQMYSSVLKAQVLDSEDPALQAFKHFLQKHVEFDNEEGAEAGHGTLVRKFEMEDKHIGPFWNHFADFLETLVYGEKAEEPAQATVSF